MSGARSKAGGLGLVAALALGVAAPQANAQPRAESTWVWKEEDGRLAYRPTPRGDRIPDFSHAGYRGGGVPLPDVAVAMTLEPMPGDDTQRIQQAIAELAARPLDASGFRGALLLRAGEFEISAPIEIGHSGIVLRGEGQGEDGTVLRVTGRSDAAWSRAIHIAGPSGIDEFSETATEVAADYVPAGTRQFEVQDASAFLVGDAVTVLVRKNRQWVSDLGMDILPESASGRPVNQWESDLFSYRYDRVVTAVDGDTLTLDAPLGDAIDQAYGGGAVTRYGEGGRIENVGIENLRAVAVYDGERDEDGDHYDLFVWMNSVRNAWVRDVTSYHFGFGQVMVTRGAKWVTIQDCQALDPAARFAGSRRYAFYISAQLTLVQRCFANDARHPFAFNAYTPGPNVFLDCEAENSHVDSGPHHRWATGGLMDNVRVPDHSIRVQNRLIMGGGHGWAGANFVLWNPLADHITLHSPTISQNWCIGALADKRAPVYSDPDTLREHTRWDGVDDQGNVYVPPQWGYDDHDDRYWDSHGQPVRPVSLYLQQLRDRLGDDAVQRIADKPYSFANAPE